MIKRKVTVKNKEGLHARPATQLVKIASKFKSEVALAKNGLEVNGKSIMGVMTLAAALGTELTLQVHGPDEEKALAELIDLFERKFDEE
ncbi:MAG: HPr family phosphocarrier protein [Calditrichaeota bacterium]|nr:HPr family phosphocarrier protein [Calditrichota bacterium]